MLIVGVLLIPLFLISLYIIFKFTWGKEGKGERGEEILNKSNRVTVPILPIGWLLLEIAHSIRYFVFVVPGFTVGIGVDKFYRSWFGNLLL